MVGAGCLIEAPEIAHVAGIGPPRLKPRPHREESRWWDAATATIVVGSGHSKQSCGSRPPLKSHLPLLVAKVASVQVLCVPSAVCVLGRVEEGGGEACGMGEEVC